MIKSTSQTNKPQGAFSSPASEATRLATLRKLDLLDTPLEERFERIIRMVCQLLHVPVAAFSLIDENRQWLKAAQGLTEIEVPRDISLCTHVVDGGMMVVTDARLDPRFADNRLVTGSPHIVFYAGCPVYVEGQCIGTLCAIDDRPRDLSAEQTQWLRDLALMVESEIQARAMAANRPQALSHMDASAKLGMIDPLTRVWNRDGLNRIIQHTWVEAEQSNSGVGIIAADIDGCGHINQAYGRQAGDAVIREVARRFLSGLRLNDICVRYDGEKFLAILPGCLAGQLPAIADKMLQCLRESPITLNDGTQVLVTASVGGVIALPAQGDTVDQTLAEAERLMTHAKQTGRDRLEIAAIGLMDAASAALENNEQIYLS